MKTLIALLFAFVPLVAESQPWTRGAPPPPSGPEARAVSMIQLIATPERYEGRLVRLAGVFQFGMEESALYLHREDADLLNGENGVWIDGKEGLTEKDYQALSGSYVLVEGVFTSKSRGHMGMFAGELRPVRRLERKRTRADYQRNTIKLGPK